jgi:NAD dependent epimerase/dehydratase family enzyme
VPAAVLRLALGDMSQILLASQRVAPAAALAAGYSFRHPRLDEALRSIVSG